MQEIEGNPTLGRTLLPPLNDRQRETLGRLLLGESEGRIASKMQITLFKLRCYVNQLYRTFGVRSRGELLGVCMEIMNAYTSADQPPRLTAADTPGPIHSNPGRSCASVAGRKGGLAESNFGQAKT